MKKASKKRVSKREPSAASLREIPEVSAKSAVFGRGPKAMKLALDHMRARRGRPKAGEKAAGSSPRSVRLPDSTWEALEQRAQEKGVTLHALLREAVAKLLKAKAA